jgi:hypothetical protein
LFEKDSIDFWGSIPWTEEIGRQQAITSLLSNIYIYYGWDGIVLLRNDGQQRLQASDFVDTHYLVFLFACSK